jgi:hypothetical protein
VTTPDPDVYWPPTLAQLKVDGEINHTRDDAKLSQELAAAVAYVERVRGGTIDFSGELTELELALLELGRVGADLRLGTIRLALRWQARGRSPDGMVASPDLGSVRVSTGDSDIDRKLRVGRFAGPVFA